MVVLDPDHVTLPEWTEGTESALLRERLDRLEPTEKAKTIISYEEPTRGWFSYLAKARTLVGQVDAYRRLHRNLRVYHRIQVLDFDERAATKFQRLRQAQRRIGAMDLKIASIVIAHDSTRLSKNVRDFSQVAGPRLEDWTV